MFSTVLMYNKKKKKSADKKLLGAIIMKVSRKNLTTRRCQQITHSHAVDFINSFWAAYFGCSFDRRLARHFRLLLQHLSPPPPPPAPLCVLQLRLQPPVSVTSLTLRWIERSVKRLSRNSQDGRESDHVTQKHRASPSQKSEDSSAKSDIYLLKISFSGR